jgi:hypothetical protein
VLRWPPAASHAHSWVGGRWRIACTLRRLWKDSVSPEGVTPPDTVCSSCIMRLRPSSLMHHASCIVQVRGGKQRALGQGKAEEALAVFDWFERKLLHAWTEVSISQVRLRALTSVDLGAGTAIDCE